jgi:hypothetical protein
MANLVAENLDLGVDRTGGASGSSSIPSSSAAAPLLSLKLTDLPNQVLVSIFVVAADDDDIWVLYTIPFVCKAFRDLYRSRRCDAPRGSLARL